VRRLSIVLVTALAVSAVSCSADHTVTTTPRSSSAPPATPAVKVPSSSAPPTASAPTTASVGDTLDIRGAQAGESLAVTVVQVVDPARATDDFSTPDAGKRFVAVQFRLKNTGTAVYSDSPGNGARLVDTQGQQFDATVEDTAAGPAFPGSVTLAGGDTGLGFVTFEIPTASKAAKVQFAMNSGFANDTGQWVIPR
jgi:hypothetical protein